MKREKRLTKKERKAQNPQATQTQQEHDHHQHIHCTACGKHLDVEDFDGAAQWVSCAHGSQFASCTEHIEKTQVLLAEHDRTGQPVRAAGAWH
jgi:Fe2+ or Zn2+ uptake regulation protein